MLLKTAPAPFASQLLSSKADNVLNDLTWNPAFPALLAFCLADSTVMLLEVTEAVTVKATNSLPVTLCMYCFPFTDSSDILKGEKAIN
jgi:hypothetical protein